MHWVFLSGGFLLGYFKFRIVIWNIFWRTKKSSNIYVMTLFQLGINIQKTAFIINPSFSSKKMHKNADIFCIKKRILS